MKQSFAKGASFIAQSLLLLKEHHVETYAHCIRVGSLAAGIARFSGMNAEKVEQLRICGLMHDIGKLMVPKEILMKKSKLTPSEFEQIRMHPIEGYHMVKLHLSETVANAALLHHERMDGSGYPQGITCDAITLEARIVMMADCFDAMTVKRSYKSAMSSEEALEELRALSEQYDSRLFEALESIVWTKKSE